MTRIETVTLIYQHPRVLLGMKKKRFGLGKYNGFGGRVEDEETLEQAAVRETVEESGITVLDPKKVGEILFHFQTDEQDHLVHFFRAEKFNGNLRESDEMKPEWFDVDKIPYEQMWVDDKYWLPLLLSGKKFRGNFVFNKDFQVAEYKLKEVENF